jgi:DnaJ-class molecular chaperone
MTLDKGDPAHLAPCEKCGGTGFVPSAYRLLAMIGYVTLCKGCDGVGKTEKAA